MAGTGQRGQEGSKTFPYNSLSFEENTLMISSEKVGPVLKVEAQKVQCLMEFRWQKAVGGG